MLDSTSVEQLSMRCPGLSNPGWNPETAIDE